MNPPRRPAMRLLPLLVLICLALGACTLGNDERGGPSPLLESSCLAPCWHGIVPEQTAVEEARELLANDPEIDDLVNHDVLSGDDIGAITWSHPHYRGEAVFKVASDPLLIDYVLLYALPPVSLEEVIDKYGEPTHLIVGADHRYPQGNFYGLVIVDLDDGLALHYQNARPANPVTIQPDMPFATAYLFSSEQGLARAMSAGGRDSLPEGMVAWDGFKSFGYYCERAYREQAQLRCPPP